MSSAALEGRTPTHIAPVSTTEAITSIATPVSRFPETALQHAVMARLNEPPVTANSILPNGAENVDVCKCNSAACDTPQTKIAKCGRNRNLPKSANSVSKPAVRLNGLLRRAITSFDSKQHKRESKAGKRNAESNFGAYSSHNCPVRRAAFRKRCT